MIGQMRWTNADTITTGQTFIGQLCADMNGFNRDAAVRCGTDDHQALEQLCRYITRPALANERVQTSAAGQVVLTLKTHWRDGTTHLVMSPLEFMQRLAGPEPLLDPLLCCLVRRTVRPAAFRRPIQCSECQ